MNHRRSTAALTFAVVASFAAPAALSDPTGPETQPAAAAPRDVEVQTLTDSTVCRRERPTGSKIAVKRCYTRSKADSPEQSVADAITRQEIDELRQQQLHYEQARLARQMALQQQALQRARR